MSDKKLTILGVVAVVMIVLAVVQSRFSNTPKAEPEAPVYLIQGLDPADIGSIVLGKGENTVTLRQNAGHFVVVEKDNYPAVVGKINELITSCLDIKTVELYTDDQKNHADLEVTEETAGNVVKFLKPDSKLLAGVVIGKDKGQGKFVRMVASDKVYVATDVPWIRSEATDYIDQELISINRDDIREVKVSGPNEVYTLKTGQDGGGVVLVDIPQGKNLKDSDADTVFSALTNLSFDDVKKDSAAEPKLTFDRQFVCRLKDSTVYTIKIAQTLGKYYVSCNAEFTDKTPVTKKEGVESEEELKKKEAKLLARDKANEFSAKHRGWIYEISNYKAGNLAKGLSELLEDEPKPEPVADANEADLVASEVNSVENDANSPQGDANSVTE